MDHTRGSSDGGVGTATSRGATFSSCSSVRCTLAEALGFTAYRLPPRAVGLGRIRRLEPGRRDIAHDHCRQRVSVALRAGQELAQAGTRLLPHVPASPITRICCLRTLRRDRQPWIIPDERPRLAGDRRRTCGDRADLVIRPRELYVVQLRLGYGPLAINCLVHVEHHRVQPHTPHNRDNPGRDDTVPRPWTAVLKSDKRSESVDKGCGKANVSHPFWERSEPLACPAG
jgi:hypothetical protein